MKIGNHNKKADVLGATRPEKNQHKRTITIILLALGTLALIAWVYVMGKKAEETVTVVMYNTEIYKNETVTEDMMIPYKMLRGEFEKYATADANGAKSRRILLWDERTKVINSFAAYTLHANTVSMLTDFIASRTDNSDSVLYSFPGKEITTLEVGSTDLESFKAFLQPGDRINVTAIYTEQSNQATDDGYGNSKSTTVQVTRLEKVFNDIMIADLLNSNGDSILDIYASYNQRTVYEQAALDADESFKASVQPKTLIIALTPEEKENYYYYLSKDCTFRITLPQRTN